MSGTSAVLEAKRALRRSTRAWLKQLTPAEVASRSEEVARNAWRTAALQNAEHVACFASYGNEIDTQPLVTELYQTGKRMYFPMIGDDDVMVMREAASIAALTRGAYGIREPPASASDLLDCISSSSRVAVLVPGLAFDAAGRRLGKGKGYYDRWLRKLANVCNASLLALCYEDQIVARVPVNENDVLVHEVCTERGVIACSEQS